MALPTNKIKKIKLPNNTEYEIIPDRLQNSGYELAPPTLNSDTYIGLEENTIYNLMSPSSVAGSSTSGSYLSVRWYASGVDGASNITTPYNGMKVLVKIPRVGVSTAGVVMSLNGDTDAEYHPVALNVNSVLTSHFPVGSMKVFVYDATATMSCYITPNTATTITGVWKAEANYDSNTTVTYGTLAYYFRPYAAETIYRYKFVMLDKDNRLVPLTTTDVSSGTAVTNQTPTTHSFRPEKIYWYNTYTTINAGSPVGGNTLVAIGYNANSTNSTSGGGMAVSNFNETVPAYRMIYLCGTYDRTTGLFTLRDGGVASSKNYYKFVPTNTANITLSSYFTSGYDYILLGGTYSSNTYIHLMDNNPMYHFDGTNLVPYDTYNDNRIESSIPTVNNNTITLTQGGVTKGSFTLNQNSDATISLDAGGGSIDYNELENIPIENVLSGTTYEEGGYYKKVDESKLIPFEVGDSLSTSGKLYVDTTKDSELLAFLQALLPGSETDPIYLFTTTSDSALLAGKDSGIYLIANIEGENIDILYASQSGTVSGKTFTQGWNNLSGSGDIKTFTWAYPSRVIETVSNLGGIWNGEIFGSNYVESSGSISRYVNGELSDVLDEDKFKDYITIDLGTYQAGSSILEDGFTFDTIISDDEFEKAINNNLVVAKIRLIISVLGSTLTYDISMPKLAYVETPGTTPGGQSVTLYSIEFAGDTMTSGLAFSFTVNNTNSDGLKHGTVTATKVSIVSSVKTLNTTATLSQSTSSNEAISGTGTITLHKISKTGSYGDLLNKPTYSSMPYGSTNKYIIYGSSGTSSNPIPFTGSGQCYIQQDGGSTYLYSNNKQVLTSHQSIKSLDTTATTAQTTSASEDVKGSGTLTLHKVSKTGTYSDLIGTPDLSSLHTHSNKTALDNFVVTSTSVTDGTNTFNLPGNVSAFNNDSGYLTSSTGVTSVGGNTGAITLSSPLSINSSNQMSVDLSTCLKNNVNGTIVGSSSDTPLYLRSKANASYIGFQNSGGTTLGYFGANASKQPIFTDMILNEDKVLAYASDIPTVPTNVSAFTNDAGYTTNTGTITGVQLNGSTIASSGVANVKALPNFNLNISHQTAGNPRPVKFLTINYATAATYFKMSATSCHDNGTSYQFLEDIIIGCTTGGSVVCNVYKYCQQSVTYDSATRNYGDVFYVIDTTNKIVDFYILCGQYASSQFTPATKIGNTTIAYITQYTGTATYYSSGTKVWANGNSTTYAKLSDVPSTPVKLTYIMSNNSGSPTSVQGMVSESAWYILFPNTYAGYIMGYANDGTTIRLKCNSPLVFRCSSTTGNITFYGIAGNSAVATSVYKLTSFQLYKIEFGT